jgi:hypothetical protein
VVKKIKYYLLPVMLFAIASSAKAQVSIQFMPVIFGQSLDGLMHVQLVNTLPLDLKSTVTIKVREVSKGGAVVTIKTPSFILKPGSQELPAGAFGSARFIFSPTDYGMMLAQTRRFPEGEYEYCFEVDISESKMDQWPPVFEQCFIQRQQPSTPLLLLSPVDGDEQCHKRPDFVWQPPMPLPADARFRLMVAELLPKQDIAEAITFNPPVINQANIPGNMLFFPSNAPELREGKKYVWQVTVYTNKTIIKKSEIWTYEVKCNEHKEEPATDSYRELKEAQDGDFYITSKVLRFSFNNPYSVGILQYRISSVSDPEAVIKGLPTLTLGAGLNKYDIDLSANRSIKREQEYLLTVVLPDKRQLKLRFLYKNEGQ